MVVVIDELERAGLAERRLAPHDRRARMIAVTAAGKRKVAEADKVKERVQAEVLGELSASEGEALIDALSKLVEGGSASRSSATRRCDAARPARGRRQSPAPSVPRVRGLGRFVSPGGRVSQP